MPAELAIGYLDRVVKSKPKRFYRLLLLHSVLITGRAIRMELRQRSDRNRKVTFCRIVTHILGRRKPCVSRGR